MKFQMIVLKNQFHHPFYQLCVSLSWLIFQLFLFLFFQQYSADLDP